MITHQLNLVITQAQKERIEYLRSLSDATISQIMARALAHYELLLEAKFKNETVLIKSKDGKTEMLKII